MILLVHMVANEAGWQNQLKRLDEPRKKKKKEDWDFVDVRCGGVKSVDEPKAALGSFRWRTSVCRRGPAMSLASCHILILKSSYPLRTR
jgi:hypothetical protein